MKLVLILMIKNESKILRRCLQAIENVVDAFCILDTGSTDNTVEIANEFLSTHTGCVNVELWKNFGYNRTVSFQKAQEYVRDTLKWNLNETYGLLLDADMVFVPGKLKEQNLTASGYRIIQMNGSLEYYNCRLVRLDFPWKCIGVTHEYWDGQTENLTKDICFIDDRNDGGCKHDKFERDCKLLEEGLEQEPQNVRYMFYLAQTYKCLGRYRDSIRMYKKRIHAGGWHEEVWYSHYMIGECWKNLGNIGKFEYWMQLAYMFRKQRVESIYKLAEHYRIHGDHYKAYHYVKLGRSVPFPKDDVLFIEGDVYRGKFDYEASILEYYVSQDKQRGVSASMKAFLGVPGMKNNILSNLSFYVEPISTKLTKLDLPRPFGEDYNPSAISIDTYPFANVRYVNYWMSNGDYFTKNNCPVQTQNAYINLETNETIPMNDSSISIPRFDTHVKGLEDVRLYHVKDTLKFTATSVREYEKDNVRVVTGIYDKNTSCYSDVTVLPSPINDRCEKNWLPIDNTDLMIYSWSPYRLVNNKGEIVKQTNTNHFFSLLRGSAPPVKVNDLYWTLVHFVEYSKPRKYYHCIVELNKSLEPSRISLPFVFKSPSVEYCISMRVQQENTLEFYVSFMDSNPHRVDVDTSSLKWISI
jgi:glycosyltransferase involved in cell wall biosynthesis